MSETAHKNSTSVTICVRSIQTCREKLHEQSYQVSLVFVCLCSNYNRFCKVVFLPIVQFLYFKKMEKRANAKFCMKLALTFMETYQMMQYVYEDDCPSRITTFT